MRKTFMKKLLTVSVLAAAMFAFTACGKKEEPATEAPTTKATTTEEATTEDPHVGEEYNELTGEWSKDYKPHRPVACMINNLKEALPSSCTKHADIIYECMVEGGITRIMPIFSEYSDLEKLGSVRSARHYYINIANEYDAIYVHYGQSKPAKKMLEKGAIDNINGMTYDAGFYRDNARVAPHNAYTTGERIVQGIADMGYSDQYKETHEKVLSFNEEDTDLESTQDANTVHVNFSNYSQPYFIYNAETKLYDRYEYGAPQVDNMADENDNILQFKNIIVQQSAYECINPKNDLQELTQVGEGTGFYITNGKAIPIKWSKSSKKSKTKYTTEDGQELLLNPGKTWISIIGNADGCGVVFE
ncbi:MAG: DUF3048 domain-containing protein [Lachnospiraceae bacterium]|nr:DUF3048 domain-containing protein [Lachnospiraceae bacterium]